MKIGPDVKATTAISGSNPDTIVVRGSDLVRELIGRISFTDHVWLLITGSLPSDAQRRVLDATLVAIAEHGLVPSVVAARMTLAASPEAMQGAVAAGLLGCGSVILGSSQAAGQFLHDIVIDSATSDFEPEARKGVSDCRNAKRAIPGYGHPLHKDGDPRAKRLFELARDLDLFGAHCSAAHTVERLMHELTGRRLVMNIPAVLLDAGYPILAVKGVPLLARTASLVAHLLEEQTAPGLPYGPPSVLGEGTARASHGLVPLQSMGAARFRRQRSLFVRICFFVLSANPAIVQRLGRHAPLRNG
jgi:citrate synthase